MGLRDQPLFTPAERAALRLGYHAALVPNEATAGDFAALKEHFDESQIVELVATIALFDYLIAGTTRWRPRSSSVRSTSPLGQSPVMNTALGTGDGPLGEGFVAWRAFSNRKPDMDIAALMRRSVPALSLEESNAYAAPFPDARYKAGVRRFPNLVPDHWDAARPDAPGAFRNAGPIFGAAAFVQPTF